MVDDDYETVLPRLKPFVNNRLLALERCPDGMRGECFFQKEAPTTLPNGTRTKLIHHQSHAVHYVVGGSLETQVALVNLGCIAVHVWQSCADHPHQPDWLVFDLDPSSGKFSDAAKAGHLVKAGLDALGVASFPKTSGSRGLRVFLPIRIGPDYDEVLSLAEEFGRRLAAAHPDALTVEQRIKFRGDRRLPRSLPKRLWRNRGGALLRPLARQSPLFEASPLGGCGTVCHTFQLQSGELREVSRGSRTLARVFRFAPVTYRGSQGPK